MGQALPLTTPWLVDGKLVLAAARGETLGIQIFHRVSGAVTLRLDGATVRGFSVDTVAVKRASTSMYGGSHGEGEYPEALTASDAPTTNPAYFEISIARDAAPGVHTGELVVAGQRIPATLTIAKASLPPQRLDVWAYFDQRELAWAEGKRDQPTKPSPRAPGDTERACIELLRAHGVVLAPDLTLDSYEARKPLMYDFPYIPVQLSQDPATAAGEVRAWIAATAGTGKLPFAIPIDEPPPKKRAAVRALADAVRAAGGGPKTFLFAVTDEPRPEYGDAVDLYIHWNAARLIGDSKERWTYNGKPPRAGSMVVDAVTPGTRTWGWIAHRYNIPVWYVWDALYWHDRHNRKGAPLPGRALVSTTDAVSFDDGEDHGNLDGVLTLPDRNGSCRPTLRLAALRRGLQDRALLEAAAKCKPADTARLAAEMIPRALGDAPSEGTPGWPTDEAAWETARRRLLDLASCR
ncbi:MAG: hypothetical protein H0V17_10170 [Deltaproteobacteria bacterium]|nr:hypothetical protein [Deltaproteobacteria bacterium]